MNAEDFNKYFCNVAAEIDKNFTDTSLPIWKSGSNENKFTFTPFSEQQIKKELMSLNTQANLDILGIDRKLLQLSANLISPSLCAIFNESISKQFIHSDFKKARVTPIFKNGAESDINNHSDYRPISVIGHLAKIFEKLVKFQLVAFLEERKLISSDQSAYLRGHSTQTSLHRVIDDWYENVNEGEVTGACIFDISKCFDTINHRNLLYKLSKYGIDGNELGWFKSYLTGRQQSVICHNKLSCCRVSSMGSHKGLC